MPVFSADLCGGNLGLVRVTVHCDQVGGHAVKVDVGTLNRAALVTVDDLSDVTKLAGHAGIFGGLACSVDGNTAAAVTLVNLTRLRKLAGHAGILADLRACCTAGRAINALCACFPPFSHGVYNFPAAGA